MIEITYEVNAAGNKSSYENGTTVSQSARVKVSEDATSGEYIAAGIILYLSANSTDPNIAKAMENNVEEVHGIVGLLINNKIKELLGREFFDMKDLVKLVVEGDISADVIELLTSLARAHSEGNKDGLIWGQRELPREEVEKEINKNEEEIENKHIKKSGFEKANDKDNKFDKDII